MTLSVHKTNHTGTYACSSPLISSLTIFQLDLQRAFGMFLDGSVILVPIMHAAYNYFEHIIPTTENNLITPSAAAMIHMFGDIFVLDAFFVASDMVSSGLMEGYGFYEDIVPQLRSDYVTSYKTSVAMSIGLSPLDFFVFVFYH